jgi:phage shock protein E
MKRIIIDVREPEEYAMGAVSGAVNVPLSRINKEALEAHAPKDAEVILYCRSGSRAGHAVLICEQLGYTNVKNGINKQQVERSYL